MKRNLVIHGDVNGRVDSLAAKNCGLGILELLKTMVDENGCFKNAEMQARFEEWKAARA